jgi:hypothetical protein
VVFYPECCRGEGGSCLLRLSSQTNDPTGNLAVGCTSRRQKIFRSRSHGKGSTYANFHSQLGSLLRIGGAMTSCYGLIVTCKVFFTD